MQDEDTNEVDMEKSLIELGIPEDFAMDMRQKSKEEMNELTEVVAIQLRRRGNRNLIFGFILLAAGILVSIFSSDILYLSGIIAGLGLVLRGIRLKSIKVPDSLDD